MKTLFAALALLVLAPAPTSAYDAETTHVGMTERAAHAARLHHRLLADWGFALGLYEPLRLAAPPELGERLARLGASEGLTPDGEGRNTALGWLLAGAALEDVPAVAARNHFYDPSTGTGLHDRRAGTALFFWLFGDREVGGSFKLYGRPAPSWAVADDNPFGLRTWLSQAAAAARGKTRPERESAAARALLALGALAHLLEDMGAPSRVRNDFRVEHLERVPHASVWDQRSAYEQFVAQQHGRLGIPLAAGPPAAQPTLRAHFDALSKWVRAHFFSAGTLPPPVPVTDNELLDRFRAAVNRAVPLGGPEIGDIDTSLPEGIARSPSGQPLARYTIAAHAVHFSLDEAIYTAYAALLLPRIVQASAGLLEFLLRGELSLEKQEGDWVVTNRGPLVRHGTVELLVEGADGQRRSVAKRTLGGPAQQGDELYRDALPGGPAKRIIAVFEGVDNAGEPLVAVKEVAVP